MVNAAQGAIKPCPIPKGQWQIYNYTENKADLSSLSVPNGEYQGKLEFSNDDDDHVGTFIVTSMYKNIVNRKKN